MISIIVCMKQVLDPEAPSSGFQIDAEGKRVIPPKGTPPVLSPFDENALEAALCIKDACQCTITVISMGHNLASRVLSKCLAVGADELLLLEDNAFENLDSYAAAHILATAISKIGKYDLIFTGRQAADWDAGQVGSGIAEILSIPSITLARKVELNDGRLRVERLVSDGYEVLESPVPSLITVTGELGELRSFTIMGLKEAQKKPVRTWNAEDIGVDCSRMQRAKLLKVFLTPQREVQCQMVKGETLAEAGANLALELRKTELI